MSTPSVQLNDVQIEKGEGGLVTLKIEVAPEAVRKTRESVIRDYARRVKIAGFRPGHAPSNIVRRTVGDDAILQALSDKLVQGAYQQAIDDNGLKPLNQAQVSDLEMDAFNDAKPVTFAASLIVRPEIDLGEVKGLELTRPVGEISDEHVENGLQRLREENATMKNIEGRGAAEGDVLNGELQVYVGGEAKGEEPANLRAFVLGQSGFVPSIDEHLIGIELDEERRFDVTYPSDFNDADLAGQVAEFAVKVTAIKERVLPELDDDFAVRMGTENLDHMRERMREAVAQARDNEIRNFLREQVAQKISDQATLEVPTELVERRVQERIHHQEHELQHEGKTLEGKLEEDGQTREELENQLREEIATATRRELILDEIAGREELKVTENEFAEYYTQMAQMLNQPVENLIDRLDASAIHSSLLRRKAVDWLLDHANVTESDDASLEGSTPSAEEETAAAV